MPEKFQKVTALSAPVQWLSFNSLISEEEDHQFAENCINPTNSSCCPTITENNILLHGDREAAESSWSECWSWSATHLSDHQTDQDQAEQQRRSEIQLGRVKKNKLKSAKLAEQRKGRERELAGSWFERCLKHWHCRPLIASTGNLWKMWVYSCRSSPGETVLYTYTALPGIWWEDVL